jgi:putative spermidine/putrescine transport system permease protein
MKPFKMRPGAWLTWFGLAFFFINLAGVIGSVLLDSVGRQWFDTWLPNGWTASWYSEAWSEFDLGQVLVATMEITLSVVALSLVLGVPAAYVLARRNFPGKKVLTTLFLLPILVPPIAYGIPLATVLYKFHLAGSLTGVVLANLVPAIPFVVFTMTPFIEQAPPLC